MATKAAFARFMKANDGKQFVTTQFNIRDDKIWSPGTRFLKVEGNRFFLSHTNVAPGSEVRLSSTHKVIEVTDSLAVIEWYAEDGKKINVTEYKLA